MKVKRYLIYLFLLFVTFGFFFYAFKADALYLKTNDVVYFVDTNDWGDIYIYIWNKSTNSSAFGWQSEKGKMTDTEQDVCDVDGNCHRLYKYVISSDYSDNYDMINFTTKNMVQGENRQTKDLEFPRNNTMFSIYDGPITSGQNHGWYTGEWVVYDKSELQDLVNEASKIDLTVYTDSSAAVLKSALDAAKLALSHTYTGDQTKMSELTDVIVNSDGSSLYDSLLPNLSAAMDGLVKKNKISVSTPVGGSISVGSYYFEDNQPINFTLVPINEGYEATSVRVIKVTGYDNGVPILSTKEEDIANLNVNASGNYSYVAGTDDIYIDATFALKQYTITTTINELEGNIDPNGPIKVEYNSNKEFKITARDGYNVKNVTVNGKEYALNNGKLTLTNITGDMEIVVTFEIKTYVVKVDGVDYRIAHGSLLSDLSSYNNIITRAGYKFEGFKFVKSDEVFDLNSKITDNVELKTVFTLIPVEPEKDPEGGMGVVGPDTGNFNPNTSDGIVYSFVAMIISMVAMILMLYYRRKELGEEEVDLI